MGALLDTSFISRVLTEDAPWSGGHGAAGDYLGMGLFYYTLVYVQRARVAVCLGSGGGFVPRLMRQAQRDLGIAHQSRTILVDGNVPEAGWGAPTWLDPGSFFRRNYPDVELVLQTTQQAAGGFFADNAISIDYLHIDADHSFEACLADFRTYRPLLGPTSVVTLHDTNFPGAGVRYVVDYLRGLPECEVVDFVDQGVGLALVRINANSPTARPTSASAPEDAIMITRKPDIPLLEAPSIEWKYLYSESFQIRNVLAAHYVRACRTVVELGGWKTPIDRFLTGRHQAVFVVDPFIREYESADLNGDACRIRHIRGRFQDVWWQIAHPREYGLVMLGLELQDLSEEDFRVLCDLVDNARTVVIEFPSTWEPSRAQYERLRAQTHLVERLRTRLDFSGNEFGDLTNSWPPV
jgi:hypothetical protein